MIRLHWARITRRCGCRAFPFGLSRLSSVPYRTPRVRLWLCGSVRPLHLFWVGVELLRVPESASLAPPTPRGLVSRWLLGTLICAPPNGNGEKRVRGREVATTAAPPSDLSEINTSEPGKPGSHTRAKCETQLREPPNGNGVGCQVGSDGANSSSFS